MLEQKVLLEQFSKWTRKSDEYQILDFYNYIIGGKSGIFALDGSRLVSTTHFPIRARLFDKTGKCITLEIPKGVDCSRYKTQEEFIEGYLFEKFKKIVNSHSDFSCSDEVLVTILDLKELKATLNYLISMFSKEKSIPVVVVKSCKRKLFIGAMMSFGVSIWVKFPIDLKSEWESTYSPEYLKDLVDLLIATKTFNFKLSLTRDKVKSMVVESNDFTSIICGKHVINEEGNYIESLLNSLSIS